MSTVNLNSFIEMLRLGCQNISNNYEYINQLNVFPVPDGDTGTNMKVTISEAVKKLDNTETKTFNDLAKTFTRDLLLFSRGNSGVIFSQVMKGFFNNIVDNKNASETELSVDDLINAFASAEIIAYKNVSRPVEGTILTVVRLINEALNVQKNKFKTVEELLEFVVKVSWHAVKKTPQMLPILKSSGVVDSGAYGLACFLEGMFSFYGSAKNVNFVTSEITQLSVASENIAEDDSFGYCTEFVLKLDSKAVEHREKQPFNEDKFESKINRIATSVVVASDKKIGLVKVHGHTTKPHLLLEIGLNYGEFELVKIENMSLQVAKKHTSTTVIKKTIKPAIVVTVPTEAFAERIREDYDIQAILCTDDTGAPSVFSLLEAVKLTHSSNIIFLLHDKNYFLSANEALKELKKQKINAECVITSNPLESLAALSVFNGELNIHTNVKTMKRYVKSFASATITRATKNYKENRINVNKDDYIAVDNNSIFVSEKTIMSCFKKTIEHIIKKVKQPECIVVYYGKNVSVEELEQIKAFAQEKYEHLFCEFSPGKQKVFSYIIGVQ